MATYPVASGIVSGQFLCAPTQYAPASATNLSVSSTAFAALSSASVNTGNFIAPASGSVLVTCSFVYFQNAFANLAFGLCAHGTTTPMISNVWVWNEYSTAGQQCALQFPVTGLTPGTSYNFDLMAAATSADTVTVVALGQTATSPLATLGAPVTMAVQAV
jgi:hypothetical protein